MFSRIVYLGSIDLLRRTEITFRVVRYVTQLLKDRWPYHIGAVALIEAFGFQLSKLEFSLTPNDFILLSTRISIIIFRMNCL